MSEESQHEPNEQPEIPPEKPAEGKIPGAFTQEIRHSSVGARVPDRVSRGVFSTGVFVLHGSHEFVLDFLLRMAQPQQVTARVVIPPSLMPQLIGALQENLKNYSSKFGPPPPLPGPPPNVQPPSIEEIYDQLKLPDDVLSGAYANSVMIGHTPAEFYFDFITTFYPRPAVSCRVYLSAPQVPAMLNTLMQSFQQFQQRHQQQRPPAP